VIVAPAKTDTNLIKDDLGIIQEATQGELDASKGEISPINKVNDSAFIDKELTQQVTLATKKGFALNLTPAPYRSDSSIKFNPETLKEIGSPKRRAPAVEGIRPKMKKALIPLPLEDGDGTTKIESKTGTSGVNKSVKLASDYASSEGTS
jgi:hypothetical protein